MPQTKQQTALFKAGSREDFWNAIAQFDCYDEIADAYDIIDFDNTNGIDMEGNPEDLTGYPVRMRPGTRPSY